MNPPDELIPVGAWIRMSLPEFPTFVGFTYVDPQAGLSAKGGPQADPNLATAPGVTVRLPMPGSAWELLGEEEKTQLRLPTRPSWVEEFYGPQPKAGTLWGRWRAHPRLSGRFHPDCPDDLQVLVHDGGPRLTDRRPELVWVRVTGWDGDVFAGRVLNKPHQLVTVQGGSAIRFVVPAGGEHPLLVTAKYLHERGDWVVHPCNKCGLSELFDAPSELIRKVFPNTPPDAVMSMFSAFCGACGGIQVVRHKSFDPAGAEPASKGGRAKRWWQFWK
jgi:hypothetical protein